MHNPFGTVRARMTAGAVLIVGVALLVGAIGFVALLRASLRENVQDAAEVRAQELAGLASAGQLPDRLTVTETDDAIAQIVDANRRVIAASAAIAGEPPISDIVPGPGEQRAATERIAAVDDDPFRVVALATSTPSGPVTVYSAVTLDSVSDNVSVVVPILAFGLPLLLVVVGATAWWITGRALRPVEAIRREVSELSARSLDRRVPVPPGDDEIARLASTMNAMLERVRAAAERQRRFVGDASHELLSPLAACRVELEVALADAERADWPSTAVEVLDEHERMERLVRDLLVLARLDEGHPPVTGTVDLDDLVLNEAERLRSRARVRVDSSAVNGAEVRGQADELQRVLRNLGDNAERHAAGTVTFALQCDDGVASLVVADDGAGIAPSDRTRVFERFTRLDDARSRGTGGTGLGLAIVQEVVSAHGGSVAIDDAGPGARIVVRLPLAR